jgi:non-ribosomal peptide synthetase component F
MVDMHHIISDGTSHEILSHEFAAIYAGNQLSPLRLQYRDYSQWQNSKETREKIKQQEAYWLKEFSGEIPRLNIPVDYPRPDIQIFTGDSIIFELDQKLTGGLKEIMLSEDVTLYMILLTIYNILWHKLTNQEDIIVGSGAAGRRHADLQEIIGMFINMMAIRNRPTPGKTFREFLLEVKKKALADFENQDYQFEMLVEKVVPAKDRSGNPLFNVAFSSQNTEVTSAVTPGPEMSKTGFKAKPYIHINKVARFDLTVFVTDTTWGLAMRIEYKTSLFKKETIRRFARYFKEIAATVVNNKDIQLNDITISHNLLTAKPFHHEMELGF